LQPPLNTVYSLCITTQKPKRKEKNLSLTATPKLKLDNKRTHTFDPNAAQSQSRFRQSMDNAVFQAMTKGNLVQFFSKI